MPTDLVEDTIPGWGQGGILQHSRTQNEIHSACLEYKSEHTGPIHCMEIHHCWCEEIPQS